MINDSVIKQGAHVLDAVGHDLDRTVGLHGGLPGLHELREDVVGVLVLLRFEGHDLELLFQGLRLQLQLLVHVLLELHSQVIFLNLGHRSTTPFTQRAQVG